VMRAFGLFKTSNTPVLMIAVHRSPNKFSKTGSQIKTAIVLRLTLKTGIPKKKIWSNSSKSVGSSDGSSLLVGSSDGSSL